jgi:hypothetical protein
MSPSPTNEVHVITSNYDRLIEVAAETAGFGVDSMFVGGYYATLDEKLSKNSFLDEIRTLSKGYRKVYRKRVKLFKPHGSLDWYDVDGEPIRSPVPLQRRRLMITPGAQKYKRGYESAFELHRNAANSVIEQSSRYLVIGYGFNDEHLEKALRRELHRGKPCMIMTMALTPNAMAVVTANASVFALIAGKDSRGRAGTELITSAGSHFFADVHLWTIDSLIKEVF